MSDYLYHALTGAIIQAAYAVARTLRPAQHGYRETQLRAALALELTQRGYQVEQEVPLYRAYQGNPIGAARVDLVVEQCVAVELKCTRRLTEQDVAQLRGYLRDGGWAVGLLLNFGVFPLATRRLYQAENDPTPAAH